MRVRERSDEGRSCPYCRAGLDAEALPCDGCGVRMHAACRSELARCPTLGCTSAAERVLPPTVGAQVEATRRSAELPLAARRRQTAFGLILAFSMIVGALLTPGPGATWTTLALLGAMATAAFAAKAWRLRAQGRFEGARLLLRPAPAIAGKPLRATFVVPPALRALLEADLGLALRAELRLVRRGRDDDPLLRVGDPPEGERAGHVRWREVAFATARAVRDGQVAFDFAPPADLQDVPGHRWELGVSCDVPGPDFLAEWDVPFEAR